MIALHHSLASNALPASRPGLFATLAQWAERHRQRRALLALDDSLLKDIGLSPADAWQEGHKPFWRG
jgi:uncharacterized protein YjiS (DUF1127 family)